MRLVALLLRRGARALRTEEGMQARIAAPKGDPAPPASMGERHDVQHRAIGDFGCYRVRPRTGSPGGVVVYVHGGGYYGEINAQHWAFVDQLVAEVGCQVEVPIYGLSPDHGPDEALELVHAVLDDVGAAFDARRIVVAGDSAGGGLALACVQQALGGPRPAPGRMLLIAPWLDAELTDPEAAAIGRRDPVLSIIGGRLAGQVWARDIPLDDPRVSPIHGPVAGLPPIDLYVGGRDLFLPDCRRFRDRIDAAGGEIVFNEIPRALHVYLLAPLPEGRRDRRRIVADLRGQFAADGA